MELIDKVKCVAKCFDDTKAQDVVAVEIGELTSIADYFVIGSGNSATQVKAIADEIEEKMAEAGFEIVHKEGYGGGLWILLDYSDVVCHIFHNETREFYSIERLWSDAPKMGIEELL